MGDVTLLLEASRKGDTLARDKLWRQVYAELQRIASGIINAEARQVTLQGTALVHEAWLRMGGAAGDPENFENRAHFFTAASEAMRRVLVDAARRRIAAKRGSGVAPETLDPNSIPSPYPDERILEVHDALAELETRNERRAMIVKLRFFAGLEHQEIAGLLGIGESSIRREWSLAKAWLYQAIQARNFDGERPDADW